MCVIARAPAASSPGHGRMKRCTRAALTSRVIGVVSSDPCEEFGNVGAGAERDLQGRLDSVAMTTMILLTPKTPLGTGAGSMLMASPLATPTDSTKPTWVRRSQTHEYIDFFFHSTVRSSCDVVYTEVLLYLAWRISRGCGHHGLAPNSRVLRVNINRPSPPRPDREWVANRTKIYFFPLMANMLLGCGYLGLPCRAPCLSPKS